ncbi:FAD dependent oxidoreductase [Armillaria fumosa]|nr:FAD dependent oxidoreductase [Armillaria fumosa]
MFSHRLVVSSADPQCGLGFCCISVSPKSMISDVIWDNLKSAAKPNVWDYRISVPERHLQDELPETPVSLLGILGKTKTAFGVKGGGHATNQGFSSSIGVQIAMTRFKEVTYDPATQTAVIGAGNIWDDVYDVLNAQGVNVLGGRVTGIGVAGLILGGGYSWLSNQYGLALDNVVTYELVVPNGTVVTTTEGSDPDLFFSLKGGGNNYGIVTRFTLKTHPQGGVWGGIAAYNASYIPAFTAASVKFSSEITDPKAGMIMGYGYTNGQVFLASTMFYDSPTPPDGIFDDFLAIPALTQDVTTRSKFSDLINATAPTMDATAGFRTVYNHIPMLNYSESVIDSIIDEVNFWGPILSAHGATVVSYAIEPFLPSLLSHAPAGSSAYPSSRDHVAFPTNLNFQWTSESEDGVFHDAARQTAERLGAEGKSIYPNYAIYGTPVVDMFGEEGVKRMEATRKRVDPHGVMMLTGGFKV